MDEQQEWIRISELEDRVRELSVLRCPVHAPGSQAADDLVGRCTDGDAPRGSRCGDQAAAVRRHHRRQERRQSRHDA